MFTSTGALTSPERWKEARAFRLRAPLARSPCLALKRRCVGHHERDQALNHQANQSDLSRGVPPVTENSDYLGARCSDRRSPPLPCWLHFFSFLEELLDLDATRVPV